MLAVLAGCEVRLHCGAHHYVLLALQLELSLLILQVIVCKEGI
jgi:hypothetical protein